MNSMHIERGNNMTVEFDRVVQSCTIVYVLFKK